ncbi:anti-sigma regulatory factor (Ser/Thr protein kinase) [Nocardia tenerifensis]|uniref:Anti-sigma regulatory factor (Ser/Thr protein kinase) n=1 Tax=Nocardia tenerifensis TaxID=228006 RepID=A0A318KEK9_9NOCA|nr:ATP-binding protein [Nocardia tenerifensis]PXX71375.1 anti-sigma regulatory factor (Ser/Thr protein kinase) [Nocardia tenerifensis]
MNASPSPSPPPPISPPPNPLELTFDADATQLAPVRLALREWLGRTRFAADQSADVLLAVGEACANAIEHGHRFRAGTIRLRAWLTDDYLRVTVHDSGRWKPDDSPPNPLRGRGIPLMRALMDSIAVTPDESGTIVELGTALRL